MRPARDSTEPLTPASPRSESSPNGRRRWCRPERRMTANQEVISDVVARALSEDIGDGDLTTASTVPPEARARALISQKAPGVIFGLAVAEEAFRALDPAVTVERLSPEGEWREGGPVLELAGAAQALLSAERTALNFLGRLSGVAT